MTASSPDEWLTDTVEKVFEGRKEPYVLESTGDGSATVFFSEEVDDSYCGPIVTISYGERGGHRPNSSVIVTALNDSTQHYNESSSYGDRPRRDEVQRMMREAVGSIPDRRDY